MKTKFKRIRRMTAMAAIISAQCYIPHAHAADLSNEDVQKLIQKVNELEEKVKILERNREVDQDVASEKAKTTPTVSIGANGLSVQSADSNFVMYAHGYIQADGRFYFNDHKTVSDTFLLRRVRPIVEGTVYGNFDYRLMLDLASGNVNSSTAGNNAILDDAYVNARLEPQIQVQVGKYKSPIGLERLESTADLMFIETGFATELTPNYDLGASIHNKLFYTPVDYSIGVYNGASDGGSDDAEVVDQQGKDVVGRVFSQPFMNGTIEPLRQLGFGVAGSIGSHSGALPSYKTSGQQTIFSYGTAANTVTANGRQYRIDPQAYYYWGPFGLLGEYVVSSQEVNSSANHANARLDNKAWQVETSYFITGEENAFHTTSLQHITPWHSLFSGGWGAFEIAGRLQQLTVDNLAFPKFASTTSAQRATAWDVGLNWYLNSDIKLNLDYESTWFRNGSQAAGSATARPEHVILSQVQFSF